MVGNFPNFNQIDILRCLLKIEGPVSRFQLSKELDLGEGTVRSILNILKRNSCLESNKSGHYLSEEGNKITDKIRKNISMRAINSNNIFPEKKKIAVHIKNPKKSDKTYILRDIAMKNGADGALILEYSQKLRLYNSDYSQDFSEIEEIFDLSKNDIVIVTCAYSYRLAEHGALTVAVTLGNELKSILHTFK